MLAAFARQVVVTGSDPARVAADLAERLRGPELRLAFVFADWRLDPGVIAQVTHRGLAPAPVVGGTTLGVIAGEPVAPGELAAVGLGLYGGWARIGIGVAGELDRAALAGGRDAVHQAAAALGTTPDALDASRHVAITLVEGRCAQLELFCLGAGAAAPQLRVVGGATASEQGTARRPYVWAGGDARIDAGVVVVLDSELPFHAIRSAHLEPAGARAVVTAARGAVIEELDGKPAPGRLRELVAGIAGLAPLDPEQPLELSFARYLEGAPYVRAMTGVDAAGIHLAGSVEVGHVLHLMRPVDLIGRTQRDLASAAERVGGAVGALLAFSCVARHWEARLRGVEDQLADVYAAYPVAGIQSFGEQSGMLLVNHTLTGLAIGARPEGMARR